MIDQTSRHFTPEVIATIRNHIEQNNENEVALCGFIDDKGVVTSVEVVGYGNELATPYNLHRSLQGDVFIHNHPPFDPDPHKNLKPSLNDLDIAQRVQNLGMGFFIIDNLCELVNIILPVHPQQKLSLEATCEIFQPNGALSQYMPSFENRPEQVELISAIVRTINQKSILFAEAGTGTGKSLSYLIPVVLWSLSNAKKVIISTHTIHLQDQIASKDLPVVLHITEKLTGKKAEYAVLTGRSNYLCKNKLRDLLADRERISSLFDDPEEAKAKTALIEALDVWTRTSESGTRRDFHQEIPNEIWEEIASDGETCQGKSCPFAGNCFYQRAYLKAEKAQIIIANHSLILSSLDPETYISFLPRFDAVVFDEAHHLEDVALKSQSVELSCRGLLQKLGRLYHEDKKSSPRGLLAHLFKKYKPPYVEAQQDFEKQKEQLLTCHRELTEGIHSLIHNGLTYYRKLENSSFQIRITEAVEKSEFFHFLNIRLEELARKVSSYIYYWNELKNLITNSSSDTTIPPLFASLDKRIQSLNDIATVYRILFDQERKPTEVGWIEVSSNQRYPNITLCHSPLEVGEFLSRGIFLRKHFTICLSATLSVNGEFTYFQESIGLKNGVFTRPIETISLPSPFDYRRQAQIHLLETPREFKVDEFFLSCIKEYILMNEGGTLVLFTSHQRLREAYTKLKEELAHEGIHPMAQGETRKNIILTTMRKNPRTAVFATSSFWEGIDIRGYNLRCVIIEKLPFDSPSDAIPAAKCELLEANGKNAFLNYSLPRALLRMKQGIGRLIRSKNDRGIVLILDGRTVFKRYATIFQKSLPPARIIIGSYEKLRREAESFIVANFSAWLQTHKASQDSSLPENPAQENTP
ncbi:ATP-dependent DNA helicase [Thermospira aquatica]|uniref:DNA 5'-3' helicase n=1 Tax=Thermospira aquatica TaxID=2828656 RepID=A0AAX3BB47_9SPIR|nr:helicase C-terminal domain-containing protein [Thermospira aquatica]URA09315.1 DEAD/DEAH box helicase family protein [Thermospira aquatica]